MVSYSTLGSGQGELVDKVAEAVRIANEQRPELAIDGEFQFDAAVSPAVAAKKVQRESRVAGKANVIIWPDLNVGNVRVKLIQQFGHADAYGPMLQGFNKVVFWKNSLHARPVRLAFRRQWSKPPGERKAHGSFCFKPPRYKNIRVHARSGLSIFAKGTCLSLIHI